MRFPISSRSRRRAEDRRKDRAEYSLPLLDLAFLLFLPKHALDFAHNRHVRVRCLLLGSCRGSQGAASKLTPALGRANRDDDAAKLLGTPRL
jgi:hypothetical protein